jgi:tRNA pseudouridine38-40 synthase
MADHTVQLVLHYDGARFLGWQRQPEGRTVQGELERSFKQLMQRHCAVTGAGRTDAGVHARGQAAHVRVTERWDPATLRRALNAVLPQDLWVAGAYRMRDDFHARYSATSRSYSYYIGTDDTANSPFRRKYEWYVRWPLDRWALDTAAAMVVGEHAFRGFAVRGTAPETDDHRCNVTTARWSVRDGGLVFVVEANRFLHHMVRFLVGTMVDIAVGRRTIESFAALLAADDNRTVSPPAPAHALFLDRVTYPDDLYLGSI